MTSYVVRTDAAQTVQAAGETVLDWGIGSSAATVDCGRDFFTGWRPTRAAADLLVMAAAYCVDKVSPRSAAADAWTRDLGLRVPVEPGSTLDPGRFDRALSFLTRSR